MKTAALVAIGLALPGPVRAAPAAKRIVRADDGHELAVWERKPRGKAKGAVLLVHGRTWSGLPDFDLQVPGESPSLMDALAVRGYAAYAIDLRGYGGTPRDASGWLTPGRAVADVAAALDWLTGEKASGSTPDRRPALCGWSRGAMTAQLVAQRHPDKISALIVYGYPYDPDVQRKDSTPPPQPERKANTAQGAAEDFVTPGSISQKAIDAYVKAALAADPVLADWRGAEEWKALDPAAVKTPTLIIQGERDPLATTALLTKLWSRLGTADRHWVVLAGGDHAAHLERPMPRFVDALVRFVERPAPAAPPK